MADTPNYNLPYPDDYTQLADVPAAVKALAEATDDALGEKIGNTDYATNQVGGVIKVNSQYGVAMLDNETLRGVTADYPTYQARSSNFIISKGTLENVLAAVVGDINSMLDEINGEII